MLGGLLLIVLDGSPFLQEKLLGEIKFGASLKRSSFWHF